MKSYKGLVLKYIENEKKSTIPIFIAIVLTIALLITVVFISQNLMVNDFANEKLIYGDYDVRLQNMDSGKIDKLSKDSNVEDYALTKNTEYGVVDVEYEGVEYKSYVYTYAVEPKVLEEYLPMNLTEGRLPKNENEILISKRYAEALGDSFKVGNSFELELRDNPNMTEAEFNNLLVNFEYTDEISQQGSDAIDKKMQENVEAEYGPTDVRTKAFTVVGVYEAPIADKLIGDKIIRLLSPEEIAARRGTFETLTYLNDPTKVKELAESLGLKYIEPKWDMNPYGYDQAEVKYPGYKKSSYTSILRNSSALVTLVLIMLFSLMCVYNTFHASVAKRIKYYGILRALGGSMKQITYLIYAETLIIYAVALPLGAIIGISLINLEAWILKDVLGILTSFETTINLEIVLIALFGSLLVVLLSVRSALKKEKKLTPIEAIVNARGLGRKKSKTRNILGQAIEETYTGEVDEDAVKELLEYEKSTIVYRVTKKLFKFEGELASKNITRDAKSHKLTKSTLFIAMSVMIFFFLQVINGTVAMKEINTSNTWDTTITSDKGVNNPEFINEVKKLPSVEAVYKVASTPINLVVNEKMASYELKATLKEIKDREINEEKKTVGITALINTIDDESIKLYEGIDKAALDNGGVILVNKGVSYYMASTGAGGEIKQPVFNKSNPVLKYGIGDTLQATPEPTVLTKDGLEDFYDRDGKLTDIKVVGTVEDDKLDSIYDTLDKSKVNRDVTLLTTEEGLKKIIGDNYQSKVLIKTKNDENREATMAEVKALCGRNNYKMEDTIADKVKLQENIKEKLGLNIIFATTMILMVVLNLVNTMNASIISREQELAGLRAIGMSEKQERRMIIGEVFYISLASAIMTLIIVGGLTIATQSQNISTGRVSALTLVLGELGIIIVLMIIANITVLSPLAKAKKISIVEAIKNE